MLSLIDVIFQPQTLRLSSPEKLSKQNSMREIDRVANEVTCHYNLQNSRIYTGQMVSPNLLVYLRIREDMLLIDLHVVAMCTTLHASQPTVLCPLNR